MAHCLGCATISVQIFPIYSMSDTFACPQTTNLNNMKTNKIHHKSDEHKVMTWKRFFCVVGKVLLKWYKKTPVFVWFVCARPPLGAKGEACHFWPKASLSTEQLITSRESKLNYSSWSVNGDRDKIIASCRERKEQHLIWEEGVSWESAWLELPRIKG